LLAVIVIGLITSCSNSKRTDNAGGTTKEVVLANDTCTTIDNYLTKLTTEKNFSGGLLIIRDGKKIFSKGFGWANKENNIPFTPSTLASIGSITKAFTSAAIMKLSEQGKLSIHDPLSKFFPKVPADKAHITLHQLLTHSSGFHEFVQQDGGDYEKIETEEFLKRAFSEPLAFKPGEKAVYTNVGMSILGIVIEQVSGMSYESYLARNLFEPLGIHGIGYYSTQSHNDSIAHGYQNGKDWGTIPQHIGAAGGGPYWNLKANGGLEASLNDMFLWANALTNATILQDATIRQMFTAHTIEDGFAGKSSFGYGCNILTSKRNTKVIDNGGSNGIYFARLIRYPQEGVIFFLVTNESSINANMVLPNIAQLYFGGRIEQDAIAMKPRFENIQAEAIYNILDRTKTADLSNELEKHKIKVDDDMVLLEVGQRFLEEHKTDQALSLYQFYTRAFPTIIVAWNDLGDVYQMKGDKQEAIKCYTHALKLRPDNKRAKESLDNIQQTTK
ncbi:MAG: serine hydrolase, partial [bacterium]